MASKQLAQASLPFLLVTGAFDLRDDEDEKTAP